ncbi:hypothetical protein Hanom_Chr16g01480081 [Helianthus anomalus]
MYFMPRSTSLKYSLILRFTTYLFSRLNSPIIRMVKTIHKEEYNKS